MAWRATAAATAERESYPPREAYVRRTGQSGRNSSVICILFLWDLPTFLKCMKLREITQTERASHFICLIAENAGLTCKLLFPQRTGLQLWKHGQLLPQGKKKVGCAGSLEAWQSSHPQCTVAFGNITGVTPLRT